jgi:hypothetical protein
MELCGLRYVILPSAIESVVATNLLVRGTSSPMPVLEIKKQTGTLVFLLGFWI